MTDANGEDVRVEWDEPGAGGIVINGERVVNFNVDTNWTDTDNPQVSPLGQRFVDLLPRRLDVMRGALDALQHDKPWEAENLLRAALSGRSDAR